MKSATITAHNDNMSAHVFRPLKFDTISSIKIAVEPVLIEACVWYCRFYRLIFWL